MNHTYFQLGDIGTKNKENTVEELEPTTTQLLKHPLAIVAAVFAAGALSGAAAKTVTAPLDRIKLIMQGSKKALKGNFAQVTYPLDVLRLRLAVDPGYQTMTDLASPRLPATIRRQMQMRGTPYKTVLDAFPGIT
ncbi:hypothetical protein L1987_21607 [Smallanthus sonchifolius]|uniref:Uncharacterized protein n=1 Tax=Smallanthus sonchifolius TaxID=185202 RepID=A0ACB9IDH4_9ASTR|nr:hypothetical protein L1987_21607 [Smallanthus sonchifolius]